MQSNFVDTPNAVTATPNRHLLCYKAIQQYSDDRNGHVIQRGSRPFPPHCPKCKGHLPSVSEQANYLTTPCQHRYTIQTSNAIKRVFVGELTSCRVLAAIIQILLDRQRSERRICAAVIGGSVRENARTHTTLSSRDHYITSLLSG